MRTTVIVVLMLITIATGFAGFVSASRAGGSAGLCGISFVCGLVFLILASRNGRKQQEEAIARAVREKR